VKATIDRSVLLTALAHISAVVERRNTIPILSNVMIDARESGSVRLMATDLDMQLAIDVPAAVAVPGATTCAAHLLHGVLRELANGAQVALSVEDKQMVVLAGRSRHRLHTLPRDDFPVIAEVDLPHSVTIAAADLRAMFGRVAFAQSKEVTRYYMMGVCLQRDDDRLIAVASNGHCLATWSGGVAFDDAGDTRLPDVIVASKTVDQIVKLIDGHDGPLVMRFSESKMSVAIGAAVLTSKLVDGTYPDWRRVVPSANDKMLMVDAEALTAAIRRVTVISDDRTRVVGLDCSKDKVTTSATSPEHGSASEEIPADYGAESLTVGFNAQYLLQTIAAIGAKRVQVALADARAATLFTNPDDAALRCVIMPMRV
jgi:DNA polymerase III subunit beta